MAFGILKVAGSLVKGVGKFIKNRRAKKEEKIEKAAAKLDAKRAQLAAIGGGTGTPLESLLESTGIFKASAASADINLLDKVPPSPLSERRGGDARLSSGGGGTPVWLWPVVIIGAIFLLPKLLKK